MCIYLYSKTKQKHKAMTREEIVKANKAGLSHQNNNDVWFCYYTPTLNVAYELGREGVDLSTAPVVSGYRYGAAPESFISFNFAEGRKECGLSLAALDGEKEIGSSVWFADRQVYSYSGILSGKGSDGEPLILAFEAENLD